MVRFYSIMTLALAMAFTIAGHPTITSSSAAPQTTTDVAYTFVLPKPLTRVAKVTPPKRRRLKRYMVYTSVEGDTCTRVAEMYGTTVKAILESQAIDCRNLPNKPGTKILIRVYRKQLHTITYPIRMRPIEEVHEEYESNEEEEEDLDERGKVAYLK